MRVWVSRHKAVIILYVGLLVMHKLSIIINIPILPLHKLYHAYCLFSGRCIRTLSGHEARLYDAHCDAIRIVSVADSPVVRIWDFHPHNC